VGKDLEEVFCDLLLGTVPESTWRNWWES